MVSKEGTVQGDPLDMAMFAMASVLLIHEIASSQATQTWFADNAARVYGSGGTSYRHKVLNTAIFQIQGRPSG